MKYIFTGIIFIFSNFLLAQNLVFNPSFEHAKYRPPAMLDEGTEFTRYVGSWVSPNYASPDFITKIFRSSKINKIPAHSGENMIGIVVQGPHWGEYASIKLRQPLEIGQKYYVEYWLSAPAYYAKKNTGTPILNDYFGIRFDKKIWITDTKVIDRKPQIVASPGTRLQPEKWIKINGSFVAEEESTHLILGQFKSKDFDDVIKGYFFIDDIYVEKIEKEAEKFEPSKSYQIKGKVASIVLDNIYFETDKYDLLPESFTELNKLVNIMHQNNSMTVEIHGHTDDQGGAVHNQKLSENRAKSVFEYLAQQGVKRGRMSIQGFGLSKPKDSNATDEGRQKNRRVEFITNSKDTIGEGFIPSDIAYLFSNQVKNNPYRLSTIGRDDRFWNCANAASVPMSESMKKAAQSISKYTSKNAASFILEKTKTQSVVFLQTQPEYSNQLVFAYELLEKMYDQGFRHLGFQNMENIQSLSNSSYPILKLGQPFQHPIYGSIIRKAKALGFKIFTYGPSADQISKATKILKKDNFKLDAVAQKRAAIKWAAAMNINRVKQQNPKDKILLLHSIFNKEEKENVKTLLSWFQKFSKQDALVIHQTSINSKCSSKKIFAQKINSNQPSILIKGKKVFNTTFFIKKEENKIGNQSDILVFHPKDKLTKNRPNHLLMNGKRKHFSLNIDKYKMNYPCLIYAYKDGENIDNAIPIDIIERSDNQDLTSLVLPPGNYNIVLRDKKERKKLTISIDR